MSIRTFLATVAMFCLAALAATPLAQSQTKSKSTSAMVSRGRYLVTIGQCNDCHSPKIFTQMGPVPDTTKLLSGHPASAKLPPLPDGVVGASPDMWGGVGSSDFTAWRGAWGTSFTANLTPDKETGLGSWTPAMFIKAMRTGKHMGTGRELLPPMPWYNIAKLTDQDLKSVFAFLQSLPPVSNAVPDPIPPAEAPKK